MTPAVKTPSPEQQPPALGLSTNRATRRRFQIGGGGAQRVRLGPPIRVSDASLDGDAEEDVDGDKSKGDDDSFEQPPTIRAKPSKAQSSSSSSSSSSLSLPSSSATVVTRNSVRTDATHMDASVGMYLKDLHHDEKLLLNETVCMRTRSFGQFTNIL